MAPIKPMICTLLLVLAGCGQGADQPAGAPEAAPGMAVSDARLVLPAVKGNPGAAYFTVSNGGDKPATIAAVFVSGAARAEMHDMAGGTMAPITEVPVPPRNSVAFSPGGKHVMAFDLDPTLSPGSKGELTVTFADGDKVTAPLTAEPAGGAE